MKFKKFTFIIVIALIFIFTASSLVYSQPLSTVTKHPQINADKTIPQDTDISFAGTTDHIYYINGNLTINGNITGNLSQDKTGVIFIEKDLNINQNYTYGTNTSGTLLVVKGNVNIDPSVSEIDAVIIAQGTIFTAGANCLTSQVTESAPSSPIKALIINGSLVSLGEQNQIRFCRKLSDNSQPAEKINHQVKYLVILRDLFSDTLQKWSEIP